MRADLLVRLVSCGLAMIPTLPRAEQNSVHVTVDSPAVVSVSGAKRTPAEGGRLVITVSGFQPSPAGPVTAVIVAQCRGTTTEIGRFGVLPNKAFVASGEVGVQRFGLELPEEPACHTLSSVTVRLEPELGNGAGASMTIQSAKIE